MSNGSKVLTFSNVGDLLGQYAKYMLDNNGNMPVPGYLDVDNVTKGPDGLTNYTWLCREAYKIIGYISVADDANAPV